MTAYRATTHDSCSHPASCTTSAATDALLRRTQRGECQAARQVDAGNIPQTLEGTPIADAAARFAEGEENEGKGVLHPRHPWCPAEVRPLARSSLPPSHACAPCANRTGKTCAAATVALMPCAPATLALRVPTACEW